jgi:hypothetical protein
MPWPLVAQQRMCAVRRLVRRALGGHTTNVSNNRAVLRVCSRTREREKRAGQAARYRSPYPMNRVHEPCVTFDVIASGSEYVRDVHRVSGDAI